jgi:hypothetical protein
LNTFILAVTDTWSWIKNDYASNRFRFCAEVTAWLISLGCSLTMAITVPNPPLKYIYLCWIFGCAIYAWAAWTRRSFGMLANYFVLMTIDAVATVRLFMV